MRTKLIGCASTKNEVEHLGYHDSVECRFLDYSYHAQPTKLKTKLQEIVSSCQHYDLIILTFGRCSNAVVGLISPRVPLLLPRTHDCIGLLLGSNERHMKLFRDSSATYYFSQGWLDYGRDPYSEYIEYVDRYGKDKALYLIRAMYGRYNKAVLIITPGIKDINYYRQRVRKIAEFFNWEIGEIDGDVGLLDSLVAGIKGPCTSFVEAGTVVTADIFK